MLSKDMYFIPETKNDFETSCFFSYTRIMLEKEADYVLDRHAVRFRDGIVLIPIYIGEYLHDVRANLEFDREYTRDRIHDFMKGVLFPNLFDFMKDVNKRNKGRLVINYGDMFDESPSTLIEANGSYEFSDPKERINYFFICSEGNSYYRCKAGVHNLFSYPSNSVILKMLFTKNSKQDDIIGISLLKPVLRVSLVRYKKEQPGDKSYSGFVDETHKMRKWVNRTPLKQYNVSGNKLFEIYKNALK